MKQNYTRIGRRIFCLMLLALLAIPVLNAQTVPVSVFNYPGLNGYGGCSDENANLIGIINALPEYDVDGSITSFSDSALLASQLDASTFFFMTDMESQNPTNTSFFPVASQEVFEQWVAGGGVMVMTGTFGTNDVNFLNLIFGWDLASASGSSWAKNSANTLDTPFEEDPASLPNLSATDAIAKNSVEDFVPMYGTEDNAVVATIKYGSGYVIFMGWDFYNSGPSCPQYSSDWVQQIIPSALEYATSLSGGGVGEISYTSAEFTYSFAEPGDVYYVLIKAGNPAPSSGQIEAGTDYDGVRVISAGNSPVEADTEISFPLGDLEYGTSYEIHVTTAYMEEGHRVYSPIDIFSFSTEPNDIPAISGLKDQNSCINATPDPLNVTFSDEFPVAGALSFQISSSNTALVPQENISVTGEGNSREIKVVPVEDAAGSTTITISVEDELGKKGTASYILTVEDLVAPTLTAPNDVTVSTDASTCSASEVELGSPVATDTCGIVSVVNDAPATFPLGTTVVTWTATDLGGNTTQDTQEVTVEDKVDPVAQAQNITVQLDAEGKASITPEMIDNGSSDACGIADLSLDITAFDCTNIGENEVILTVEDNSGNLKTAEAIVTVKDEVAPVALVQNITVQLDAEGKASITPEMIDNGSSDACGIADLSLNVTAFDCTNIGENKMVFMVEDSNGNTSTAEAIITVEDKTAPVAQAQNITVQLDAEGKVSITPEMIDNGSNDVCGIGSLSLSITAFDCTNIGDNEVILTVEDNNGNISTAEATVTVEDKTAPVALAQNIVVQLDSEGKASITPEMIDNNSSDACGIAELSLNVTTFDCTNVGENPVILTVVDVNGNSSTASAIVIVEEDIAPVVVAKDLRLELDEFGQAVITPQDVHEDSMDNCGIALLSLDRTNFSCGDEGEHIVVLTATDFSGNTATSEAIIEIVNPYGDNDADGLPDNCDGDDDNDGVPDAHDNAVNHYNPDQLDTDGDNLGNVIDHDDDEDGVLDEEDNCPLTYNPGQEDIDKDGMGDVCDTVEILSSQAMSPNGDGINDTWRIVNIESHSNSHVRVYNQWGKVVFEARAYRNDWNGRFDGDLLPEGSYYYQIDLEGDGIIDADGWLYLTK